MIKVYGYNRCSTVKKSLQFLEDLGYSYKHIDNVENKLSKLELKLIHETSGVEIKKLFNSSGVKYRELNLKDQVNTMELEDAYTLLATDGMLVKRPILITPLGVRIGFKKESWLEIL